MVRAMVRCWYLVVVLAACGTTTDNRPLDAQYITEAILAPTCGAANCHSTFAQNRGDVFDTLEGMRRSIVDNGLVTLDSTQFDPADPPSAQLIQWVTKIDPLNLGIGRMPFDAPMPNEDIYQLERWITGPTEIRDDKTPCSATLACTGAGDTCQYTNGVGNCVNITFTKPAYGAQCNPKLNGGTACFGRQPVHCDADWNFGAATGPECSGDCSLGVCL
jgi:hypothetical protein